MGECGCETLAGSDTGGALWRDAPYRARLFGLLRETHIAARGIAARFHVRGFSSRVLVADDDRCFGSRLDLAQAVALISRGL